MPMNVVLFNNIYFLSEYWGTQAINVQLTFEQCRC